MLTKQPCNGSFISIQPVVKTPAIKPATSVYSSRGCKYYLCLCLFLMASEVLDMTGKGQYLTRQASCIRYADFKAPLTAQNPSTRITPSMHGASGFTRITQSKCFLYVRFVAPELVSGIAPASAREALGISPTHKDRRKVRTKP